MMVRPVMSAVLQRIDVLLAFPKRHREDLLSSEMTRVSDEIACPAYVSSTITSAEMCLLLARRITDLVMGSSRTESAGRPPYDFS